MNTVTFCGHSKLPKAQIPFIKECVKNTVESLIKNNKTYKFLLGGYGDFDILCANVIKDLKEKYPYLRSVLVFAYLSADFDRSLYDYAEYPPLGNVPYKYAIPKRNQFMINSANIVIAYVQRSSGGAAKTLEYAKKKKKQIIQIDENFISINDVYDYKIE